MTNKLLRKVGKCSAVVTLKTIRPTQPDIAFFIFDYRTNILKRFVLMGKNGKSFSIIHERVASCSKPKLAPFVFNNRVNFIKASVRGRFPCPFTAKK